MSNPRPVIEHVGEMYVKQEMDACRGVDFSREIRFLETIGKSVHRLDLIRSIYAEANKPLDSEPHHNKMLNCYSHQEDSIFGRPIDRTCIEIPSQLYEFNSLRDSLQHSSIKWDAQTSQNCIMMIYDIPPSVTNSVLLNCREISQNQ